MAQEQDNLYKLWQTVQKDYELPDYETFKADMQDSTKLKTLWQTVEKDYELPEWETFKTDMGYVAPKPATQKPVEKKKTQPSPEAGGGSGFLSGVQDFFGGVAESVGGAVESVKEFFTDEEESKTPAPKPAPAKQQPVSTKPAPPKKQLPGLEEFTKRQQDLASGKISRDDYAQQVKEETEEARKRYKQKVEDESVDFYVGNADVIGKDPVGGYLNYLKVKNPERYQEIEEKKKSGRWDVGANPIVKSGLDKMSTIGGQQLGLGAGYEVYAELIGEKNTEDSSRLYRDAINWKASTESAYMKRLKKLPMMQKIDALQGQLEQNPAAMTLSEMERQLNGLAQNPAVKEYARLGQVGAASNNQLPEKEYKAYQELGKTKEVAQYKASVARYQQMINTPEGQKYAAVSEQLQGIYASPEYKQVEAASQKVFASANKTEAQEKAWSKKFPLDAFKEAEEKTRQEKVDAFYKRMNPVFKLVADPLTTLLRVPYQVTGELLAGGTRAVAGAMEGITGDATRLNDAADVITNFTQGLNDNIFPQPTNLQLPMYDNYAPYAGHRVYTNGWDEVIDVRDADGYAVPQETFSAVSQSYSMESVKPKKINDFQGGLLLPRLTQTAADLYILAQVPAAGGAIGMGRAASMVTYGYLSNYETAYEEIRNADPFMSEEAAHLYANTKGLMMGALLTLTPQTIYGNKNPEFVWKEIGKEYTKILAGGTTANKGLGLAMAKVMNKEGLTMAGIGFGMDLSDRLLKAATNAVTDRPTLDTEYKFTQAVETGLSMYVTGAVMAGMHRGFKGLRGDALYTGLKNYERTVGELEQMANAGKISQQDFTRASGMLTQLKPIYDNLADMGKFNDAYKSQLIGAYAEKLRIEEKLGKLSSVEALQRGASPERDLIVQELNAIDNKIEQLAIINNPEFVVYTKSVEEVVDQEVLDILNKVNRKEQLTKSEEQKLKGQRRSIICVAERRSPKIGWFRP